MAIYRCKMCGGNLEATDGSSIWTCDSCGTSQTIPRVSDENLQTLFNRANVMRMKSEFDKAEEIYERIVQESPEEAEAYWGIVLSRYGIEYVEDPGTGKRIPTCHRASYDAVAADEDYKNAIKYADSAQREIYETEAKAIDEIQKRILSISQNEKPYDVFICYKETDESGKRTVDSTIGNDIYYQLTSEGLKVFYAAISLEDKLGQEYEPYIFSALNSAKVMLCLGTKPEYFNAVWVKNEWSRYLKLMKKDRSKTLIPCYRDMDAYELPEEFSHLQAQDMSKIGFINDLVRGIRKVISNPGKETKAGETSGNDKVNALVKRGFIVLEDKDWRKAEELADQILNSDPENAQAYLIQMMAKLKIGKKEQIPEASDTLDDMTEYQRVMRFGDEELKKKISGYNDAIRDRIHAEECDRDLLMASDLIQRAKTEEDTQKAIQILQKLSGWKNADELLKTAEEKEKNIVCDRIYTDALKHMAKEEYEEAIECFEQIPGHRESDERLEKCRQKIIEREEQEQRDREAANQANYERAVALALSSRPEDLHEAVLLFERLDDWKDSKERKAIAEKNLQTARQKRADKEKEQHQKEMELRKQYDEYIKHFEEERNQKIELLKKAPQEITKIGGGKFKCFLRACRYFFLIGGLAFLYIAIDLLFGLGNVKTTGNGTTSPTPVVIVLAVIFLFIGIKGILSKAKIKNWVKQAEVAERELKAMGEPLTFDAFCKEKK